MKCLQHCFYLPVLFHQTVTCSLDNPGPVSYRRPIKTRDYEQEMSYSQIIVQPTVPRRRDTEIHATGTPITAGNDVARTLKSYAQKRETMGSSSDSLPLSPFSKWELLLKERICSQRERILSFKSSSIWYGKPILPQCVTSLECCYFYYARA